MGTVESVDLVGLCAEECARVGATLDVPEGMAGLEVQGVAKLLRRMVRNLLENAMRHGAAAGHEDDVVLILQRENGWPVLRVCDRGPGVPPEYRDRIFEPFFRLPGASERAGGVGLGLALVKSIAERHGWIVRCEDRDGGGACFVISRGR
jgi:signal transduction histidine kinase